MELSKSILTPARRGLRGGGGGGDQVSPFFAATGKKRGSCYENPAEPSSPKVTCIGQVRVRTKKKVKMQNRSLSRRRQGKNAEDRAAAATQRYSALVAAADCPPHRNQRWVHLPASVGEAFLALGAELSCFKGSCFTTRQETEEAKKEKTDKHNGGRESALDRWLVPVEDGGAGRQRVSVRRHVFEDLEVEGDRIQVKGQSVTGSEEAARLRVSIPPRNALLLMRCRSDPLKMAALMNRLNWDNKNEGIEEEEAPFFAEAKMDMEITEKIESEEEEEVESNMSSFEALLLQGNAESSEYCPDEEKEVEIEEGQEQETEPKQTNSDDHLPDSEAGKPENQELEDANEADKKDKGLPECLLLMMREPKLSMEVSKETWICSTDFVRWPPHRRSKTTKDDGCRHDPK